MTNDKAREAFQLDIVSQGWIMEGEDQALDMCSHGSIRAVIDGTVVSSTEAEYGISQSALVLLRTIDQDHSGGWSALGETLLCHGCGYPFSFGCGNFGTDWTVEHAGDDVLLYGARHHDASRGGISHEVRVRLPREGYAHEVVTFARAARDFYMAAEPRRVPEDELAFHREFWREFDDRLEQSSRDIRAR